MQTDYSENSMMTIQRTICNIHKLTNKRTDFLQTRKSKRTDFLPTLNNKRIDFLQTSKK